jgi:hypothetical protein
VAALFILILPETLNKTLPQTIEDTEQMGLVWYGYLIDFSTLQTSFLLSKFKAEDFL